MLEMYHGEPPQFVSRPATDWETQFADALQALFRAGVHDLDGIVSGLIQTSVAPPKGDAWTVETFKATLKEVGW
jgi:hypothetical protein